MLRVAIAADHAGLPLKREIVPLLKKLGCEVLDLGAHEEDPLDDYPEFAQRAGEAVRSGKAERAVIVCGSGVGASIAANKMKGIRAGLCHDTYSAHQGVEHDDINTLCLGSRIIGSELAFEVVRAFIQARFTGEERHQRRLQKVLAIESEN
jgi:ribose 5-phosphate isomerase B